MWKFVSGDLLDWKQSSKWVSKRRGEKIWREKVDELFEFLGLKEAEGGLIVCVTVSWIWRSKKGRKEGKEEGPRI